MNEIIANVFDYDVFVNTIAKEAQSNYEKNLGDWYNAKMRFTNPKFNKGYFALAIGLSTVEFLLFLFLLHHQD